MTWRALGLILVCLAVFPQVGTAQVQTIRKEVRQIFGGSQSPDDARIGAITRAKREALEEAGTYLESLTIVRNHQLEQDEILALSSGVLKVTIVEEEPFVEGSAFGIRVVAEVQVDRSTLDERVRTLLADRQHFDRLLGLERRQRELLERLAALELENAHLGTNAMAQGQEALKEGFAESSAKLSAQELLIKGLSLWNSNSFTYVPLKEAIDYFTQALHLDPDYAQAYNLRGNAYTFQGQYQRAIEDFDRALRLDSDDALSYSNRSSAYTILGQYQRAIEDCNQAIRLDTNCVFAYNNRGNAYNLLGQYQRAIEDFDQALRLDPDNALFYYNRGLIFLHQGEYHRAIEDFDNALRLYPDYAKAYNNRGVACFNLKQYQRAIEDFDRALRLDPDLAVAYYNRGFTYDNLGQRKKALQDWRKACELGYQPACEIVK